MVKGLVASAADMFSLAHPLPLLPSGPEPVSGGAGLMADPLEEEKAAEEKAAADARVLAALSAADEEEEVPWPKTPPSSPPAADAPKCGGGETPPDLPFLPTHYCAGCNNTFIGKVIRLTDDEQHFGEYCRFQCVVDHMRQEGHAE